MAGEKPQETGQSHQSDHVIMKKREKVRKETMRMRRELNRMEMLEPLPNSVS
jgi:hypothetical protein